MSVISFIVINKGSSENAKLSKSETEKIIIEAVNTAFEKTIDEQKIGLKEIHSEINVVNDLIDNTKSSIIQLGLSAEKISEVTDNIVYKMIHSELILDMSVVYVNDSNGIELFNILNTEFKNVLIQLEIGAINAQYNSSNSNYNFVDYLAFGSFMDNSFTYYTEDSYENGFNGLVKVKNKLLLKTLGGKFENLKIGDAVWLTTNLTFIKFEEIILMSNGIFFKLQQIDSLDLSGFLPTPRKFKFKIIDINI